MQATSSLADQALVEVQNYMQSHPNATWDNIYADVLAGNAGRSELVQRYLYEAQRPPAIAFTDGSVLELQAADPVVLRTHPLALGNTLWHGLRRATSLGGPPSWLLGFDDSTTALVRHVEERNGIFVFTDNGQPVP